MRIERCHSTFGSAVPDPATALLGYPVVGSPSNRGFRQPLGMYNVSITRVVHRLTEVLNQLDQVFATQPFNDSSRTHWEISLLDAQERFLYALFEHIEDCSNILRVVFQPDSDREKHESVRIFEKNTKKYRDLLGKIVTRMKHNQSRLRAVVFWDDERTLPGYFVEGVDPSGVIGPDRLIHGGNTAFSFARDLRFHFASMILRGSRRSNPSARIEARAKECSSAMSG